MNRFLKVSYGWLVLSVAALLFLNSAIVRSQEQVDLAGIWEGAIELPGTRLGITIEFKSGPDGSLTGDIDIPLQNARDLPLSNIRVFGDSTTFDLPNVPGSPRFAGVTAPDRQSIAGDFTQGGQTFPFQLTKKSSAELAQDSEKLEQQLARLRAYIDTTMKSWKTPGLAMAIVKDGSVVFSEGFGFRDVDQKLPVTPKTLFAIGSSSKAFTAMSVGLMVNDGKIEWDTPVRTYLPDFELHNPYASDHMTPRDLLCHRSGLPRHDLIWYGSSLTRAELFSRLKYLEPNKDFRETWQYQNLMFMTAGYLVGKVSESSWEEVVRTRIFEPLGMNNSNFSIETSQKSNDFALPYLERDDALVRIPFRNIDEVGPAGSINSNIEDMVQWVFVNLDNGKLGEKEILPEAIVKELQKPQMVMGGNREYKEFLPITYGLGWMIQPYRGHLRIHHGGNIDGFSALVSFLPDDNIGMVVLTNRNGSSMPFLASLYATDLMLDLEPVDWHGRLKAREAKREGEGGDSEREPERKTGTKPAHPLEEYAGTYEHPAYGTLSVAKEGNKLVARDNGFVLDLEHWHYEVFRGVDRTLPDLKFMFTFVTNTKGDVDQIEVPLEPSVDPIVFSRKASEQLSDSTYLAQFVGEYELRGTTVTVVHERADLLTLTVPGQPTYELEPYRTNEFNLKGLKGFSVRFTVEDDEVTEVVFHQPNGVFPAPRKK